MKAWRRNLHKFDPSDPQPQPTSCQATSHDDHETDSSAKVAHTPTTSGQGQGQDSLVLGTLPLLNNVCITSTPKDEDRKTDQSVAASCDDGKDMDCSGLNWNEEMNLN